jgi:hypothetical protein
MTVGSSIARNSRYIDVPSGRSTANLDFEIPTTRMNGRDVIDLDGLVNGRKLNSVEMNQLARALGMSDELSDGSRWLRDRPEVTDSKTRMDTEKWDALDAERKGILEAKDPEVVETWNMLDADTLKTIEPDILRNLDASDLRNVVDGPQLQRIARIAKMSRTPYKSFKRQVRGLKDVDPGLYRRLYRKAGEHSAEIKAVVGIGTFSGFLVIMAAKGYSPSQAFQWLAREVSQGFAKVLREAAAGLAAGLFDGLNLPDINLPDFGGGGGGGKKNDNTMVYFAVALVLLVALTSA